MSKINKNWQYWFIAVVFFGFGFLVANLYQQSIQKSFADFQETDQEEEAPLVADNSTGSEWVEVSPSPETSQWQEVPIQPVVASQPSGKFVISEIHKISADKDRLETGETVNFTVTLKNEGSKKKHLTHICFNHTGGVTFGCLLDKNILPGREFNLNNSMMFSKPGNYRVWVTWSQDKTNFYRPLNAGTATVTVE